MPPCDLLFVFRHSPYGSSLGREGLEAALAAGAFEQDMAILFMDDGVYQLASHQSADAIAKKNHQKMASALPLFGIDTLYVATSSLEERGLNLEAIALDPKPVGSDEISALINKAKTVLSF